jgi:hypothetical protein
MEFDFTLLLLGLVASGIGYVLFTYGRRQARWPQLVCGLVFMVYPYFTGSVTTLVGGGVMLGLVLYGMLAAGW